jgi:hypothetical protein
VAGCRGLVIHAPDDVDVPFRCAEEIVGSVGGMELRTFDGLGHRNILFTPQVARTITSYLGRTVHAADSQTLHVERVNAPSARA